ncbi:Uncharacterised protein [uncultured archaeon]|nr:Uncharacterised protein [uncultured archaeon]
MPVYGGKKLYAGPTRLRRNLTRLWPDERIEILVKKRGRLRQVQKVRRRGWMEYSSVEKIEGELHFPLKNKIKSLISGVGKKGRTPVVVDWGCGAGVALEELASSCKQAKFYGFSNQAYPSWDTKQTNVRLIHAQEKDFKRYFKKNSADLIYSNFGLWHTKPDYVLSLIPVLRTGGEMVANILPSSMFRFYELIPRGIRKQAAYLKKDGVTTTRYWGHALINGRKCKVTLINNSVHIKVLN